MPENPFEPRQRPRTIGDVLLDAHGRDNERRQRAGKPRLTYGQFVDEYARDLDRRGKGKQARAIRDFREQKRIAGRESDLESQAFADVNAEGGGGSVLGGAVRALNPFAGDRSTREMIEEDSGSSPVQDAARLALLGGERFADVASLGTARALKSAVAENVRPDLAGLPEDQGLSDVLRGRGTEIMDRGDQALREVNAAQGVSPTLATAVEKAGEIVGLLTPAGYIGRLGNVLKLSRLGKLGVPFLGRLLQNPIVNMVATEGLISEGEIRTAEALGESDRAAALREGQGSRLANAAVLGVFQKPLQLFGRAVERGLLRVGLRAPQRAATAGKMLKDAPNLWAKAVAAGSHVTGKAAEFQLFGLVPQVYRPGADGGTELSPWVTTILNPQKIAEAMSGKSTEWQRAVGDVFEHLADVWREEGLAGAIVGALGARHAPVGGAARARDIQSPFALGPRTLDAETQAREGRRLEQDVVRAGRAALSPQARRAMREALEKDLEGILQQPEAIQAIVDYVAAASEAQGRMLKERGYLPPDTPSVVKQIRDRLETELGPELFEGPAKSQEPGLGVAVEMVGDPARPGQPGRKGELLERIRGSRPQPALPGTSPGQGVRKPIELARVRWEDGTLGVVPMDRLIEAKAPLPGTAGEQPGTAAEPAAGAAERPAGAGGTPEGGAGPAAGAPPAAPAEGKGTFGLVQNRLDPRVRGELVRVYTNEAGDRFVDVRVGGEVRTALADAWVPVKAPAPAAPPAAPAGAPAPPASGAGERPPAPSTPPAGAGEAVDAPQRRYGDVKPRANETPEGRRRRRIRALNEGRKRQAFEDRLTGLPNRRAREKSQARADAAGEATLLADVRGLKAKNAEEGGQVAGDRLLLERSQRLAELAGQAGVSTRRVFRDSKPAVFREGGDEFVVHGKPEAIEKLRALLEAEGDAWHVATGKSFEEASANLPSVKERNRKPPVSQPAGETPAKPPKAEKPDSSPAPVGEKPPTAIADRPVSQPAAEAPATPAPAEKLTAGKSIEVRQAGTPKRIAGRYALVDPADLLPSHDAGEAFKRSEGYPEGIQPRDYADRAEQAKVLELVDRFDPAEVVNTSPRADQGPPTVAWDGKRFVVLNGNGRAMALREVLKNPEWRKAYAQAIQEAGESFGLKGEEGKVLVRVVDLNPAGAEAKEFARRGNIPSAQRQKPLDRAAAEADLLSDDVLKDLAAEPDSTLSEAVKGPKGKRFRELLSKRLGASGNDLFQKDGTLTEAGEEFVEGMLLVKSGLSRELLGKLDKGVRRTVAQSTVQLAQLQRDADLKPFGEAFNEGLRFFSDHLEGGRLSVDDFLSQGQMFGEIPKPTLEQRVMAEFIRRERGSPRKMRDALAALIKDVQATGEGSLLKAEGLSPLERMGEVLGVPIGRPVSGVEAERADAVKGFPDPEDPSRRHELDFEWREEDARIPDPVRVKESPVGGLTMPTSATPQPTWNGRPVGQREMIDAIADLFDVPVRVGRSRKFATRRGTLGFFTEGPGGVGPRTIRLKRAGDVVVATHEAGHSLERLVFPELMRAPTWQPIQRELERLGRALYGNRRPWNGYESEGFAEFMRLYLTQPTLLPTHARELSKWFDGSFMHGDKRFHERLAEIREMAKQFGDQGAYNRILANVVKGKVGPSAFEKALSFFSKEKWWDQLTPIERLVQEHQKLGGHLDPHQDPYVLAAALRNTHSARAQYMAQVAMIDPAGNKTGRSLNDAALIVKEAARKRGMSFDQAMQRFGVYLVAMRSIDLHRRSKGPANIAFRDALDEAKRLETEMPELRPAGQIVWEWNRGVLTYMRELGAITQADYDRVLQRSKFYVPFQRLLPDSVKGGLDIAATGVGSPLKSIGVSGREIKDPFPAMVAQASSLLRFAHQRAIMQRIADLGRHGSPVFTSGMGKWIERVDRDVAKKALPLEFFKDSLEKAGVDLKGADLADLITWYEPKSLPDSKDPIIPVRTRGGDIEWYQVKRELWDATQALDVYRLPGAFDLFLGAPARLKRLGTTGLRASFSLVTNPIRDLLTMAFQSREKNLLRVGRAWVKQQAAGLPALFGKDSHYRDLWKALGGEMAQPLGQDTARSRRLGENLGRTRLGKIGAGLKKGRVLRATGDFLDLLRDVFQVPEGGPRAAEMELMAKRVGYVPGQSITFDQSLQMLLAGKQVTVDFSAAGRYAKIVNAAVPFFNVAIQGPRAFLRAYRRNPIAATMIGLGVTSLTLALWNENKDEEWWKDLPWAEKFGFWHIKVGDQRVKIPRPFEIADVFATLPEASMDSMYRKDPRTVKEALGSSFENLRPDILPVLGQLGAEQLANRDFFRRAPIVPRAEQGMPAEEQFGSSTTIAARELGQAFGWSPRRIDHAIESIFGGVGRDVARRVTGQVEESTREKQPSDLPIVGRLLAQDGVDGLTSQAVEDFFDLRAGLEERSHSEKNPATPRERAALRLADRAAKRIRILRDRRLKVRTVEGRSELHRQMRDVARETQERIEKLLGGS